MYITYERSQREVHISRITAGVGIRRPFSSIKVPKFKPSKLVRVSNMEVVPGSSVNDQYWALSYSWDQSGEIICKGGEEYERVDKGEHTIVSKHKILSWRSRKKVNFERLIQQICKDFGIRYIWYDQMCIDQDDRDSKLREIRQMHLIYECARCVLALVPELAFVGEKNQTGDDITNTDVLIDSQWSKRMWTLEEAYMSRNILFVGLNVHLWSNDVETYYHGRAATFIKNIQDSKNNRWKACTALWYAKRRISSKAHDYIFALANIFPELKDCITFNYDQPIRELMIQFYGLLAQKDLSILEFGYRTPANAKNKGSVVEQKQSIILPSWTGMHGTHIPQINDFGNERTEVSTTCCSVNGEYMSLTSEFISAVIKVATFAETSFLFGNLGGQYSEEGWPIFPLYKKPRRTESKTKNSTFSAKLSKSRNDHYASARKGYWLKMTHVLPLKMKGGDQVNTPSRPAPIGGLLSLTEDSYECIILHGIQLDIYNSPDFARTGRCYPVIKKDKDHYRSIGVCFLFCELDFSSMVQTKQTFTIR